GPSASEEILPFTPMRKTIAERMVKSRQTSAHVVTFFEADFSAIARFREGKTLTYLPFVINAVTRAIKDVPLRNSSCGESGLAIMGVGAVQKRPVVINDAIAIRPMCYLSLAFDHRVIDGATADQFMSKVKAYLEQSPWEKHL